MYSNVRFEEQQIKQLLKFIIIIVHFEQVRVAHVLQITVCDLIFFHYIAQLCMPVSDTTHEPW